MEQMRANRSRCPPRKRAVPEHGAAEWRVVGFAGAAGRRFSGYDSLGRDFALIAEAVSSGPYLAAAKGPVSGFMRGRGVSDPGSSQILYKEVF